MRGKVFASTMCTGNLRSGTECLYQAIQTRDPQLRGDAGRYFGIILAFIIGAVIGVQVSAVLLEKAILAVAALLACALALLARNSEAQARE